MAKKKPHSFAEMIGETVGDVVDATSVAATGSQLGLLELAAEEEMSPAPAKRKRKPNVARKKKKAILKAKKKTNKNRGVKRPHR